MHRSNDPPSPDAPRATTSRVAVLRLATAWAVGLQIAAALSASLPLPAAAQGAADVPVNERLPRVVLTAGIHRIQAEVADTPEKRSRGLMMRRSLGANEGMIFVFERSEVHCFWMKNTPLPLSIAFIADDGRIVNIEQMAPQTEDSHCPTAAVRYALEMEQGWFERKGIRPGDRIGGLVPAAPSR